MDARRRRLHRLQGTVRRVAAGKIRRNDVARDALSASGRKQNREHTGIVGGIVKALWLVTVRPNDFQQAIPASTPFINPMERMAPGSGFSLLISYFKSRIPGRR